MSIFTILLGLTLSCGGVFLLAGCNFKPETSESGGSATPIEPENPENPDEGDEGNPDDEKDDEVSANVNWNFTVQTMYRDSTDNMYYSSAGGYFTFNWRYGDNTACKFGGGLYKKNISTEAAWDKSVSGGGEKDTSCSNLAKFTMKWTGAEQDKQAYISIDWNSSYPVKYACFGMTKDNTSNGVCRSQRSSNYINGNGVYTYSPGATNTMTGTYYIVFRKVYSNTYDLNGGTYNNSTSNQTQTTYAGIGYDLLGAPTRAGYTFAGWLEGNNELWNSSRPWGENSATKKDEWANSDKIFTAQWTPINYRVDINILNPNGGQDYVSGTMTTTYSDTGETHNNISDQARSDVPHNSTITITNIKPAVGMALDSVTCSKGNITSSGGTYTYTVTMTGDSVGSNGWDDIINVKMRWASYTVSFNSNGGSSVSSKTVTYNSTYGTLSTPTKTGYSFGGWYRENSFQNQVTSSTVVGIGDHTLYAKWSPNLYTVTFNPNGGSTPVSSKSVTYDSAYGTLPTPTRTGDYATFKGWMLNGSFVTASTIVKTAGSHTLLASWLPSLVTININIKTSEDGISYANSVVGGAVVVKYKTYLNVAEIEKSASINDAVSSISNVVLFSTLTIKTTSNTGYVYAGTSYASTPPASSTLPNAEDTFRLSSRATVNIFFKKTAKNILKFEKAQTSDLITNVSVVSPVVNSIDYFSSLGEEVEEISDFENQQEISSRANGFELGADGWFSTSVAASYRFAVEHLGNPGSMLLRISFTGGGTATFTRNGKFYNSYTSDYIVPLGLAIFTGVEVGDVFEVHYSGGGTFRFKVFDANITGGADIPIPPPIQTKNYGFAENSQGYYESQNHGQANSYSFCRVSFTVLKQTQFTFIVSQSSETANDFGIFGNLNQSLSRSMNVDSFYYDKLQNRYLADNKITYTVSPGNHFIDIKFRKNESIDSGADRLMFKFEIPRGDLGYFYFEDGEYPQSDADKIEMASVSTGVYGGVSVDYDAVENVVTLDGQYSNSGSIYYFLKSKSFNVVAGRKVTVKIDYLGGMVTGGGRVVIGFGLRNAGGTDNLQMSTAEPSLGQYSFEYVNTLNHNVENGYLYFFLWRNTGDGGNPAFNKAKFRITLLYDGMSTLLKSSINMETSKVEYYLTYFNGSANVDIPVYMYNGQKYAYVTNGSVSKWFKVEPIRWRVSEYDTLSTDYPSGWGNSGAYNTNFTVVSDKVLGFSAVTGVDTKEGWGFAGEMNENSVISNASNLYENTKANSVSVQYAQSNANVFYDKFGPTGSDIKVCKNLFDFSNIISKSGVTTTGGTFYANASSNNANNIFNGFKIHHFDKSGVYKQLAFDGRLGVYNGEFVKDANSSYLRIGFNGNLADATISYDLRNLKDGTYAFSANVTKLDSSVGGSGIFTDLKLVLKGADVEKRQETGIRVASVADIKTNLTDLRAKASDMVKFLLGLSSEWADYWTRDLGNNLDNGIVVTKSGIEKSTWLNQMKGVRFAMTMDAGSRLTS